jgi:hypothetical protein
MNIYTVYIFIIVAVLHAVFFWFMVFFFGRLSWLQMRIWLLAKRGYIQVENIGEDKVRRYYYLRPKNNKFDLKGGFYLFFSETITKTTGILKRIDHDLLLKNPSYYDNLFDRLPKGEQDNFKRRVEAEKKQYKELHDYVSKLIYSVDAVTLRWGIPTITYYGTDPNPIMFSDRKKVYDAGVLNDMYLRILLTQKYSVFRKWMIFTVLALGIIAIALILLFSLMRGQANTIKICQQNLNSTYGQLVNCINSTAYKTGVVSVQNSTVNI